MKRVLVIEDNADNMVLITRLLSRAGYATIEAVTGLEGYRIATEELPDFVVLDIQLPDIEGTEVLRRLRANASTVDITVIAMTSYAMAGDRERFLRAGCNGYIEKPINPMQVIAQIKEIVGE
jgi:two-component system, cell cycle response regulator DivK